MSLQDTLVSLPVESALSLCSLSHSITPIDVHVSDVKNLERWIAEVLFACRVNATSHSSSLHSKSHSKSTSLQIIIVPFAGSSFRLLLARNESIVHCLLGSILYSPMTLLAVTIDCGLDKGCIVKTQLKTVMIRRFIE